MTLLHMDKVTRSYGAVLALADLTTTVYPGDRLAIAGPNGAGKSTLLGLIDGTITPTTGSIILDGTPITRWPVHRRANAGIARVFQHPLAAGRHTALGNVLLGLHRHARLGMRTTPIPPQAARQLDAQAMDILDQVGLPDHAGTLAARLSHGQRRQLDIAMALATRPRLLLLDEPTAGLSTSDTERILTLLHSLPAELAVVLVEHDSRVVQAIATSVLRLENGRAAVVLSALPS